MLFYLTIFVSSIQRKTTDYDLLPPHMETAANEYRNWSLSGTTVNLKHSIRLTSDLPNQRGSICQLVPTMFRDWVADIELAAYGGDIGGECYIISFTKSFCPEQTFTFDGVSVVINTSMANGRGESPIYLVDETTKDKYIRMIEDGMIKLRSEKQKSIHLRLTRIGDRMVLDESMDNGSFHNAMTKENPLIPEVGYFTITAATGNDNSDVHDLISFKLEQKYH